MPLLSTPSRPKPPRMNKRRQITQHDSQTTLREEPETEDLDIFDIVTAPPVPPKLDMLDMNFDQKALPITPHDSTIYLQRSNLKYKPPPPLPKQSAKQSTSNRWKSAIGKVIGFKKSANKVRYQSPPLSPASSRQPSFYGPAKDQRPHRSAVTLLNSAASTLHSRYDEDEDMVTNIGLSRSSSQNATPISPVSPRGIFHVDHYEPISTVLRRADSTPSPTPVTALPISPITPAPRSITPPSRYASTPPPPRDSPQRSVRTARSHRSMPAPARTPSPPPFTWPPPGSPPLIVANPSPPSPTPVRRKRAQTVTIPQVQVRSPGPSKNTRDGSPTKRVGPRILQARLPSPVAPNPENHVFIGPWFNRRGDEWLGIGAELGEYRSRAAKEDKAFDPKYMAYPEEPHHFMNPKGDVMDAQTLRMVSKAARL